MSTTAAEKVQIGAYLHGWCDINPEQHRSHVDFEPAGSSWSDTPVTLTCPAGWHTAPSKGGTVELYDDAGNHVTLVTVAGHRKSVEWASARGTGWLSMRDGGGPVCPTCGHPTGGE